MSNYCVCCGKEIPDGSQVCFECIEIAKDDRKELAQITLEEIECEIQSTLIRLQDLIYRRQVFKNASLS